MAVPNRAVTNPHIQYTNRVVTFIKPLAKVFSPRPTIVKGFFISEKVPFVSGVLRLLFCTFPNILEDNVGMTVMETMRLNVTALLMAIAISRNSWPASSWTKTIGRNTATVVSVLARTAPQTSTVPS